MATKAPGTGAHALNPEKIMSRRMTVAAVLVTLGCADPGAVTSPDRGASFVQAPAACSAGQGQQFIDAGEYKKAIQEFSCLIQLDPTAVEGYRGRIEARLLLGEFAEAQRDYTQLTAFAEPLHPDAYQTITAGYSARLAIDPDAVAALTGLSFAHWYFFNYPATMHTISHLLDVEPDNLYGTLFQGSSRVLMGTKRAEGAADLERAIQLDPSSPDVRFIVADAYTYGSLPDLQRAFLEATIALQGGLNTARVRAIRGAAYNAFGNTPAAAAEIAIHFDLVTTELVGTSPLTAGSSKTVALVPGRSYEIPLPVTAGQTVSVATSSKDYWDTILVLLAPDGTPVLGADDTKGYMAGFDWVAPGGGTYKMRVTFFESVNTGDLLVSRK